MRKIIFLDIDGVIATPENIDNGSWGLVDTKQELLGEILKYTNADIVLSSSWRENDLHNTKMYMDEKGFWYLPIKYPVNKVSAKSVKYSIFMVFFC